MRFNRYHLTTQCDYLREHDPHYDIKYHTILGILFLNIALKYKLTVVVLDQPHTYIFHRSK